MKRIIFLIFIIVILIFSCGNMKAKQNKNDYNILADLSGDLAFYNPNVKYRGSILLPEDPKEKFIAAVNEYNINIIRVSGGETDPDFGKKDCFLYNDLGNFISLNKADLQMLDQIYDWTSELGIKLIIDHHHAAGRQWGWGIYDFRLFEDFKYHDMTVEFWRQMAEYYKDKEDIIFGLLNEPYFFQKFSADIIGWDNIQMDGPFLADSTVKEYIEYTKGTPADLNILYNNAINAIRKISPNRIIIIEPDKWSSAEFMQTLEPIYNINGSLDENIWYSFHIYEPYPFTHDTENIKGKYPGTISSKWEEPRHWDKEVLRGFFERVEMWRKTNNIPKGQIICSEFNTTRWADGAAYWLSDIVNLIEEYGYNWTYYMFREDDWDFMDCELGVKKSNKIRKNDSILMNILYEKFKHNEFK